MMRLREAGHRGPTIMYSIWKIMCFLKIKACQHILLHQIHKIMIFKKASYDPFKYIQYTIHLTPVVPILHVFVSYQSLKVGVHLRASWFGSRLKTPYGENKWGKTLQKPRPLKKWVLAVALGLGEFQEKWNTLLTIEAAVYMHSLIWKQIDNATMIH